ncbi:Phosphatidylinositol 4-kinase pik1alpha (PI4-kinase)(PtdIns-4-kinase) [Chytridiales sp. JEL 0842]|nr:Phosphatidylinositol 4-kinase pik1alpha (PI4-kinase)(PtdIns-4-kinase) [Chytridiales sp. JEL 0842]
MSPRPSMSQQTAMKLPTSGPSIEDLSRGQAFNQLRNKNKLNLSIPGDSEFSLAAPSSLPSAGSGHMQPSPQISDYFHTELQFLMALCGISDRLRAVPKESRQICVPLWCPAQGMGHKRDAKGRAHHSVVRVSPNDAVTLNSADRVPYLILVEVVDHFHLTHGSQSFDNLTEGNDLTTASSSSSADTDSNLSTPENELSSASSESLPVSPIPLSGKSDPMSPKPTSLRRSLSNPRRSTSSPVTTHPPTPNHSQSQPHSRSSSANPVMDEYTQKMRTAAIMLAQLHHQQQRELIASSSTHLGGSANSLNTSQHSLLPSGQPAGGITAAMAAASIGGHATPPLGSSQPVFGSAPGSPISRQRSKTDFEAIRSRLVKEMAALEEKRIKALQEERANRAMLQDGTGQGGGGVGHMGPLEGAVSVEELERGILEAEEIEKDKDDPSAAVFQESWEAKCARIRASSPYGSDPSWKLLSVIVKTGGDLRQEVLALQLIKEMQRIWREEKVPIWSYSYRVLVTSDEGGLVETVKNAISVHSIKKEGYKSHLNSPGQPYSLLDYYRKKFGPMDSGKFRRAQDNFMRSLAAYSIICYILQVKDRHNGNILIDAEGHLIHIDFGFMLSNTPGNVGFEQAPFKLSQDFINILGGTDSHIFQEFRILCQEAFLAVRKRWDVIVALVEVMEDKSTFPCFTGQSVKPKDLGATAAGSGVGGGNTRAVQSQSSQGALFGFLGGGAGANSVSEREDVTHGTMMAAASYSGSGTGTGISSGLGMNPNCPVSAKLRDRFCLNMTETQVREMVDRLVDSSMNRYMRGKGKETK